MLHEWLPCCLDERLPRPNSRHRGVMRRGCALLPSGFIPMARLVAAVYQLARGARRAPPDMTPTRQIVIRHAARSPREVGYAPYRFMMRPSAPPEAAHRPVSASGLVVAAGRRPSEGTPSGTTRGAGGILASGPPRRRCCDREYLGRSSRGRVTTSASAASSARRYCGSRRTRRGSRCRRPSGGRCASQL